MPVHALSPRRIQLIALDLDGTLLGPDHETVGDTAIAALREFARQGTVIVPTTGRAFSLVEPLLEAIDAATYVISSNGARLTEVASRRVLSRATIPARLAEQLRLAIEHRELPFELYQHGRSYYRRDLVAQLVADFPPLFGDYLQRHSALVDDFAPLTRGGRIEKISVTSASTAERDALIADLSCLADVDIVTCTATNIEITARGVTKASGLARLADHLGITPDGVLAFGDSGNDASMLAWAGMSVAMGNAAAEARAAATWLGPSHEVDGVGLVLSAALADDGGVGSLVTDMRLRQEARR